MVESQKRQSLIQGILMLKPPLRKCLNVDYTARDWIGYRTNKTPYKPNGEHISSERKEQIRNIIDDLLLGEGIMPNLKKLIDEIVTEAPGGKEPEPNWAKIYRKNNYDRCVEMIKDLEQIKKTLGSKPKPNAKHAPNGWELDIYELDSHIGKLISLQSKIKLVNKGLRSYAKALNANYNTGPGWNAKDD